MMWQLQIMIAVLATELGINVLFAGLCMWAALGLSARWFAVLSAVLYLALAFV